MQQRLLEGSIIVDTGKKIKKIIFIIIISVLIIGGVIAFLVIRKEEEPDYFAMSNEVFFETILMIEEEKIEIHSVDAYYLDGYCYYHVFSTEESLETGEPLDFELVYYALPGQKPMAYNPNWTDLMEFKETHKDFLKAKENGKHYKFTDEEIAELVKKRYEKE